MMRVACTMAALTVAAITALAQTAGAPPREIDNVAAFAQLYGVARFFYPSDAAAAVDWDRFAIDGVARVRTASDTNALVAQLRALFVPLGPGIEVGPSLTPFRAPAASSEPLVAWRYLGAGATDNQGGGAYAAKRTNRPRRITTGSVGFAGFMQTVPAQDLRGRPIRLRGQVRAIAGGTSSGGALWLRVDRTAQGVGFFDNMSNRLVREASWREYVIEGSVVDDATAVAFGVMSVGDATADFDALELSVRESDGSWRALPIRDAGFEADTGSAGWNRVGSPRAQVTRLTDNPAEGRQFVRFAPAPAVVSTDELFPEAAPTLADHVDVDLGIGLRARISLTLTDSQAKSASAPHTENTGSRPDLDERLADVVVAWNFYRHFYPYFSEAAVDWNARLRVHVQAAYEARTRAAEADALRRLVSDARDGHGRVNDMRQRSIVGALPLQLAIVESRVVVTATSNPSVPVGAVISAIDGVPATDRFSSAMQLASGSAQWRQFSATQNMTRCLSDPSMRLTLEGRNDPLTVPCVAAQPPAEERPKQVAELSPGVWYVDLTRARTADVTPVVDTLAKARGVVFDVRGYPTDAGAWILPHLIDAPESDRWMHVSKIVGPFGMIAGWQDLGWDLKPAAPKLAGEVVFLTDGRAISYAESVMGYVADRHLGTIVGNPTAGTNGNIATFTVPGGFTIVFTGMRVTKHDGRAVHHLVGVKPDVTAVRTIAGIRAGQDEVLARALTLVP
jgi:hypothetical protein